MANDSEDTKHNLLIELESIQGLLGEDDIPVLQEVIDELDDHRSDSERHSRHPAARDLTEQDLEQLKSAYRALADNPAQDGQPPAEQTDTSTADTDNTALPGQQGLFDSDGDPHAGDSQEPAHHTEPRPSSATQARGDNPFLPQHIRDRLRGNRAGDFPPTEPSLKTRKALVDELVAELTPQIESSLRLKLAAMTERELAALKDSRDQTDED